jgi:hypothetical protein
VGRLEALEVLPGFRVGHQRLFDEAGKVGGTLALRISLRYHWSKT